MTRVGARNDDLALDGHSDHSFPRQSWVIFPAPNTPISPPVRQIGAHLYGSPIAASPPSYARFCQVNFATPKKPPPLYGEHAVAVASPRSRWTSARNWRSVERRIR